jgi:hypothetical protein
VVASGAREEVLDAAVIAEHFGTPVRVIDGEVGWAVVPKAGMP